MEKSSKVVHSKRDFFRTLHVLLIFSMANAAILMAITMLIERKVDPVLLVLGVVLGVGLYWLCLKAFTTQYIVSLEGVKVKSIWVKQDIDWQQVQTLFVHSVHYFGWGGNLFNLEFGNGKRHVILISFIGNHKEVAQAIIEAATSSNPQVQLSGLWESAYGSPPYGIFTEQSRSYKAPTS